MTQRKVLYIDPDKFQPKESSTQDELVGINTTPSGGSIGQLLKKTSNDDYNYSWEDSVELKTGEPTGFSNRTDSELNFNDLTRIFSISPSLSRFSVYLGGERFDFESNLTSVIPDITGEYYIYFDSVDKQLKATSTFDPDIFAKHAIVSILYWQSAQQKAIYFADERHGIIMDGVTHSYLHQTLGAQYRFGLGLKNIIADANGSLDSHSQFGIDNGRIADEDIEIDIVNNQPQILSAIAQVPVFYRIGTDDNWYRTEADNFALILAGDSPFYTGTNRPASNELDGTDWELVEVPQNKFLLMHVFATNDVNYPVVAICGKSYDDKSSARKNAATEILLLRGLPFAEFSPIGTLIFQCSSGYGNTPNSKIVSTDLGLPYVDFRGIDLQTIVINEENSIPAFTIVRIPLSGLSFTVTGIDHGLLSIYSYNVQKQNGAEVVINIIEDSLSFVVNSLVDMTGLDLVLRGF